MILAKFRFHRFSMILLAVILMIILDAAFGKRGHRKRIIGGHPVPPGKLPFIVSIADSHGNHFCGATIIDKRHLVTAAHCFVVEDDSLEDPSKLKVTAGETDLQNRDSPYIEALLIWALMVHPAYDTLKKNNDIAVARLVNAIAVTPGVKPISRSTSRPPSGTKCTVSGWGLTKSTGTDASRFLLEVEIEILSFSVCETPELGETFEESEICAGVMKGGHDSCRGDSGGPLVCSGTFTGVVSFGYDCGLPQFGAIYTDVAKFKTWVDKMIAWDGHSSLPRMRKSNSKSEASGPSLFSLCILMVLNIVHKNQL
ncbi:anionic trypsin-1-like [Hermetia illucens]|uniref:anionic trypsin-1-like n=1 Tax=Hermetia illucens TaxID=343691 RepID=UPI0018CC48CC|nr:anionic trypsin-1-like [Hermetia illucens]